MIVTEAHELSIDHRHDERVAVRQEAETAHTIVESEPCEFAAAIIEPYDAVRVDIGQPQRSVMPSWGLGEYESRSKRLNRAELHAVNDYTPRLTLSHAAIARRGVARRRGKGSMARH